ncbi:MAG: respiratory nitrate reductase subunit gamma [Cytophagales bacterium]|nr:respiratory nitrate reductase subunit gamma [Cytophagales bacterium]
MNAIDNFLFVALPYIALAVFLVGSIYRYRSTSFKFSSLSSQFLEGRRLFWGSIPFHWGILFLFFGHLTAFLIPQGVLAWNSHPLRLIILEVTAFIFAISVLTGLVNLIIRRTTHPRLKVVSNYMDIVILLLLLLEVVTGLGIAYGLRWGSSWFAAVLTPYLRSVFVLQPEIEAVSAMPWPVKLHIAGAFTIVLLIPFSRLVHFLVPPINYAWRSYQVVIWYWGRKKVRNPKTAWTMTQPKNT